MKLIPRLISYIFPLTTRIKSEFNGVLEITLTNGRKILDSANANYSYGSLQRILKFALEEIYSPELQNVLLLGLGGGSVVATLRQDFGFTGAITAVDIDPTIIRIARDEFGITDSANTRIGCADAAEFLRKNAQQFDLIIVDLFLDNQVPDEFLQPDFWRLIQRRTARPGSVIFNTINKTANTAVVKNELTKHGFTVREYPDVEKTNTILIARHR